MSSLEMSPTHIQTAPCTDSRVECKKKIKASEKVQREVEFFLDWTDFQGESCYHELDLLFSTDANVAKIH